MDVPSNPPQKSRGWQTWLKRLLVGSGLLLLLAGVFHAPLLRWVIAVGGGKGAEMAGIKLAWLVDGSVLGDIKLSKVEASGCMIEKATIGEFTVEYDAWRAARTGEIDIISRVALQDVEAVMDLRNIPAA